MLIVSKRELFGFMMIPFGFRPIFIIVLFFLLMSEEQEVCQASSRFFQKGNARGSFTYLSTLVIRGSASAERLDGLKLRARISNLLKKAGLKLRARTSKLLKKAARNSLDDF
jgi:hypothetical protein